jgi:lipoprotein-anchoring transpeptidase ErfK/SrfK
VTVDAQALKLSLVRDGKPFGTYPVSLGIVSSPTRRGVKIITEKSPSACLHLIGEAGYHECGIKYVQRLTESGEYLLAAPWNVANIGIVNTTSGGTELLPADAQILFKTLQVGDPINYPNATGPLTSAADDGYWNVSWTTWRGGGLVPTH